LWNPAIGGLGSVAHATADRSKLGDMGFQNLPKFILGARERRRDAGQVGHIFPRNTTNASGPGRCITSETEGGPD
jgi:hypothetical protein